MGKESVARLQRQRTMQRQGPVRTPERRHLRITVLAGGVGLEREVSLNSGQAVAQALGRLGHEVLLSDISPEDQSALDKSADFVFIALHGEFGEDGTLQAELDRRQVPYCGSGPIASGLAMNKVLAKRRFESAGLLTPRSFHVTRVSSDDWMHKATLPAVVKPVASGSSVDTSIVKSAEQLRDAVGSLVAKSGEALVERFVPGRELTVGVLGAAALPVCEIRTKREFYDYQAKYVDDDTEYLFDLDFPPSFLEWVQRMSVRAHQALGCGVFSRVDWRIEELSFEPLILEVNTIPGFTSHSLLPKSAARINIGFEDLCQRIIDLSMAINRS